MLTCNDILFGNGLWKSFLWTAGSFWMGYVLSSQSQDFCITEKEGKSIFIPDIEWENLF